jgi:hypothetical protein
MPFPEQQLQGCFKFEESVVQTQPSQRSQATTLRWRLSMELVPLFEDAVLGTSNSQKDSSMSFMAPLYNSRTAPSRTSLSLTTTISQLTTTTGAHLLSVRFMCRRILRMMQTRCSICSGTGQTTAAFQRKVRPSVHVQEVCGIAWTHPLGVTNHHCNLYEFKRGGCRGGHED